MSNGDKAPEDEIEMILADDLRKAVLQAAIQGKLTQQMTSDSDVDEFLAKISEEKLILAERKNARKDKDFGEISETEIEFDIPDSWRWIRVGDIGVYKKGPFGSSLTKSMFVPKSSNAVKVYEQKNAIQKDASLGEYYITREYYDEKMSGFRVESGDIIVSCAGTIGETYVMPENIELGIINQALMRMNIVESINLDYFLYYFDHVLKISAKKSSNGSAIKNIPPFDVFKKMLFPVPPIEEQQRIVEKLDCILSEIDEYSSAEQELITLQSAFPDDMRKSILQYAMQGKLVEQDPDEGTGEELYQQIQAEKVKLIKEGKFKKDNTLPSITDNETPFDIPESWKWVRLGNIVTKSIKRGKSPTYTTKSNDVLVFAQKCNVKNGGIDLSLSQFLDPAVLDKYPSDEFMIDGDVVINSTGTGTLGRVGIYRLNDNKDNKPLVPDSHVTVVRLIKMVYSPYLYYIICNYQKYLESKGMGSTKQKELKPDTIKALLIPLPPYDEQRRIAEKLDRILPEINGIKEAI